MDFPANSRKAAIQEEKKVEQVTSASAVRRKKPLKKQFSQTFIGGDARSAAHYVIFNVLIPAAKDALAEAGASGIEKLIFGESRGGRRGAPSSGATGHVAYNRMGPERGQRSISKRARAQHDFDEIVLVSRTEAEEVIDRLFDLLSRYEAATVADLYDLTGLNASHIDHQWGWTDLRGARVARTRSGGYLLDLPDPEPLGR